MNNIGTLYIAEIKKVFQKKSVWISLILGICIILVLNMTYVSSDGHIDYVRKQREVLSELSGTPMDEKFFEDYIDEVHREMESNPGLYRPLAAYDPGTAFMNASKAIYRNDVFLGLYDVMRNRADVDNLTADRFYAKMRQNIVDDAGDMRVSDEELNVWLEEFDGIEKPLDYTYALGYYNAINVLYVVGWAVFIVIAISLSGVFADEKTSRTDAVILSTRKGRGPLCTAKILAGISIAVIETLLILGLCILMLLCIYGFKGSGGRIQSIIAASPWDIAIGRMLGIYIILALVTGLLFALSNMLLSHITGSAVVTMAIHTAILFGGLFNVPESTGIVYKFWQLRPTLALYFGTFLNTFRYGPFNNVQCSLLIYFALAAVFAAILTVSYRKSQVESR